MVFMVAFPQMHQSKHLVSVKNRLMILTGKCTAKVMFAKVTMFVQVKSSLMPGGQTMRKDGRESAWPKGCVTWSYIKPFKAS